LNRSRYRYWMMLAVWAVITAGAFYRGHQVTEGHKAFERLGCATCHGAGGAPSLEHVGRKYDRATLVQFISDPETIYAKRDHKPLNAGYLPMPRLEATLHDAEVLSYFLSVQR
jgi:mono/diheme cytochrome c family protein